MFNYKKTKKNSKLTRWLKECAGKVKHKTKLSAEFQLEMTGDKKQNIYKCSFCGHYHIGKTNNN